LSGQLKFGPDVEYITAEDYSLSAKAPARYYEAIVKYFPGLQADQLQLSYAGIRPKLQGPGEPERDFEIQFQQQHGVPGLVQLFGIESPGLTSALAIADYVGERLQYSY